MTFIQIIEVKTQDIQAIRKAAGEYRRATQGKATIRREILTRDRNDPSRYFNLVFFDSYESAMKNSSLPETQASAGQFENLTDGPPTFYDLDVINDRT
jgi:hypothetical protein